MRNTFVKTLIEHARKNPNVVLLTGDLGAGALEPFEKEFGNRYINCGIAEQNMIAVASGLAKEGRQVVIYSIGNFITLRVLEFLRNLVCYNNLNIKIVTVGGGLEYGALGFTHHTTEDVCCMASLPNIKVLCPATINECEYVTKLMLEDNGPCFLRLNKKGIDLNYKASAIKQIYDGQDGVLLSYGTVISQAVKTREILANLGQNFAIISLPVVYPLNNKALAKTLSNYSCVCTIEEHNKECGLGSFVAMIIAQNNLNCKFINFGFENAPYSLVGDRQYLYEHLGLDAKKMAAAIIKKVR